MGEGSTGDLGGEELSTDHEFVGTYDGQVSDCINCDAVLAHLLDNLINYSRTAGGLLEDIFDGNKPDHGQIATVSRRLYAALDAMVCRKWMAEGETE